METKKYHKTDFYFWKITLCLASASFFRVCEPLCRSAVIACVCQGF